MQPSGAMTKLREWGVRIARSIGTTPNPRRLLELDLGDHIREIWYGRYKVVITAFLVSAIGVTYALLQPPVYRVTSKIQPKAENKIAAGFGLIPGSQLSRLRLTLESGDLARHVIQRNPDLVPEIFPEKWDSTSASWESGQGPSELEASLRLKGMLEIAQETRDEYLVLAIETESAYLSKQLLDTYLSELNNLMRTRVRVDADSNRAALYRELERTMDPNMKQRLTAYIESELQRPALVDARMFDIIDSPVLLEKRTGPNRRNLALGFGISGVLIGLVLLYIPFLVREVTIKLRELQLLR